MLWSAAALAVATDDAATSVAVNTKSRVSRLTNDTSGMRVLQTASNLVWPVTSSIPTVTCSIESTGGAPLTRTIEGH